MKTLLWLIVLFGVVTPAMGHRLDEYLQSAMFSVQSDHITLNLRLTPGAGVVGKVLAELDVNGDGIISDAEQQDYAELVRGDLSVMLDGRRLELKTVSSTFTGVDEMKQGLGEIVMQFRAEVPPGGAPGGAGRTLMFENHHQPAISVYLVNCLVPTDRNIWIVSQNRNYDQSHYQLVYTQSNAAQSANWAGRTGSASIFKAFFFHGVRHILTGYDHLLFVSALVLAATTLWDLIKVVSAFTIAHTITLTLATLHLVHVSSHIVEPLISASIVFVAMQNVFLPRSSRGWSRLGAAFFFGLFHGLGFAGGLADAMGEMPGGTMFVAIAAFSIGVEAGHQMVVLPLFGLLKALRSAQPDVVARTRLAMTVQRIGSAGISCAGIYYLWVALA